MTTSQPRPKDPGQKPALNLCLPASIFTCLDQGKASASLVSRGVCAQTTLCEDQGRAHGCRHTRTPGLCQAWGWRKGVCGEPFTLDDCFVPPLGPVVNFLPQMLLLVTHSEPDQELWSSARNTEVISVSPSASWLSIYSIFLSLAICPWICLFGEENAN